MIQVGMKNFREIDEKAGNIRLAQFMSIHHALERSALADLGHMKADIAVGPEQITYFIGAGERAFVLKITGEPDENFTIRCDRVQQSRGEPPLIREIETTMDEAEETVFKISTDMVA